MARYPNGVNYKFIKPKCPEMDKVAFALLRCMRGKEVKDIAMKAGHVSRSTIDKLRSRKTRYPRFMTVYHVIHGCGLTMYDLLKEIEDSYPTPETKKVKSVKNAPTLKTGNQKYSEAVYAA